MSVTSPSVRPSPGTSWQGRHYLVRAGLPDTFFSIPARLRHQGHVLRGFLSLDQDGALHFTPEHSP